MTRQPSHVAFTARGIPAPQGSKKAYVRGRRAVLVDDNTKTLGPWRGTVIAAARHALNHRSTITGPVIVDLAFTFPRPASHRGTGRNTHLIKWGAPRHHVTPPDLDKLIRAVGDALTIAGVICDDKQIVAVHASKHYATAGHEPGVEVDVTRVDTPTRTGETTT